MPSLTAEERQARDAEICRLRRQRLAINKIGDRLGCGHHTIIRVLDAHGLSGPEYYSQSARGPKGHVAATHKHGPYKLPQPQLTARRMAQQRNDPALCNRCGCPLAGSRTIWRGEVCDLCIHDLAVWGPHSCGELPEAELALIMAWIERKQEEVAAA